MGVPLLANSRFKPIQVKLLPSLIDHQLKGNLTLAKRCYPALVKEHMEGEKPEAIQAGSLEPGQCSAWHPSPNQVQSFLSKYQRLRTSSCDLGSSAGYAVWSLSSASKTKPDSSFSAKWVLPSCISEGEWCSCTLGQVCKWCRDCCCRCAAFGRCNCTQSIKIITDSRSLRLGILDPLLGPWKWRFEARRFHLKIISHQASLAYGRHVEADYWFKKGPTLIGESFTEEQLRRKGRISELRLLAINRA